jgi:hypothetical protein
MLVDRSTTRPCALDRLLTQVAVDRGSCGGIIGVGWLLIINGFKPVPAGQAALTGERRFHADTHHDSATSRRQPPRPLPEPERARQPVRNAA